MKITAGVTQGKGRVGTHRWWRRNPIVFPCPACQRPIEMARSAADGSSELPCPHCSVRLIAPAPDHDTPARLSDPEFAAAQQFQQQHGRQLVDLKRGRLASTTARAREREIQATPASAVAVAEIATETETESRLSQPPSMSPSPAPPVLLRKKPVRPLTPEELGQAFTPLDDFRILPSADGDPLEWDHEPAAGTGSRPVSPWMIATGIAGATVFMGFVLHFTRAEVARTGDINRQVREASQDQAARAAAAAGAAASEQRKIDEAFAFARAALASRDWRDLLPQVRHPQRVAPLMEDYYAAYPWKPSTLTDIVSSRLRPVEGREFLAIECRGLEPQGHGLIGLENTPGGWKLDWEVCVPLYRIDWLTFLEQRPTTPRALRVSAIRRTPSKEQLALTGVAEDRAFGVMIWSTDIAEKSLHAVLEKDAPIARELAEVIGFDHGKKIILELAFLETGSSFRDDLVTIRDFVTVGWTYLDDPPGDSSR